eukprot:5424171-Karenia_brevis.AAC.1
MRARLSSWDGPNGRPTLVHERRHLWATLRLTPSRWHPGPLCDNGETVKRGAITMVFTYL